MEELKGFSLRNEEGSEEVCNLVSGVRMKNLSPPASLKEISLVQLDSISLSHQMLVRCTAIIGLTFTTELLFEVLPCWNMKMMIKTLATLVELNIFYFFPNGKDLRLALKQNATSFEVHHWSSSLRASEEMGESHLKLTIFPLGQRCIDSQADLCWVAVLSLAYCLAGMPFLFPPAHREEEELQELEGEVIECHIIRLSRPIMQKTAYELWLKDQKKAMHLKCAGFLEENAHRCDHCRSWDFNLYHHFMVDILLNTLGMNTIKKMTKPRGIQDKPPSFLMNPSYSWELWRLRSRSSGSGPQGLGLGTGRLRPQQPVGKEKVGTVHTVLSTRTRLTVRLIGLRFGYLGSGLTRG
ncbi:hypothetical protein H1C71_042039 [Ictidomys tridecemlineatus]|nr:hypothetical protein H1C71_042039 [Ictidomys tridecemlineatus]